MKIKFEVYSTLLKEVKELSDELNKNFNDLTGGHSQIHLGYKIGEVVVENESNKDVDVKLVKQKLETEFHRLVPDQKIWLKEVSDNEK